MSLRAVCLHSPPGGAAVVTQQSCRSRKRQHSVLFQRQWEVTFQTAQVLPATQWQLAVTPLVSLARQTASSHSLRLFSTLFHLSPTLSLLPFLLGRSLVFLARSHSYPALLRRPDPPLPRPLRNLLISDAVRLPSRSPIGGVAAGWSSVLLRAWMWRIAPLLLRLHLPRGASRRDPPHAPP